MSRDPETVLGLVVVRVPSSPRRNPPSKEAGALDLHLFHDPLRRSGTTEQAGLGGPSRQDAASRSRHRNLMEVTQIWLFAHITSTLPSPVGQLYCLAGLNLSLTYPWTTWDTPVRTRCESILAQGPACPAHLHGLWSAKIRLRLLSCATVNTPSSISKTSKILLFEECLGVFGTLLGCTLRRDTAPLLVHTR